MQSTPFVTDILSLPHTISYQQLKSYLNNIKSKLSYADYKQQITLLQNYQPLAKIIRRTKALKQEHQEKFKEDDGIYDWYYEQRKDTQQYLKKLQNQLIQLKENIQITNWKKEELKAEVEQRRNTLKSIMHENKNMIYNFLENKIVPRSVEVSLDQKRRAMSYNSLKNLKDGKIRTRKLSSNTQQNRKLITPNSTIALKTSKSNRSIKSNKFNQSSAQTRYLYEECLAHLSKNIKSHTSSSVQSGIFLDILQTNRGKDQFKPRKNNRQSNNLIYQVLLNSYKQSQKKANQSAQDNINIQWQTFKRFNGKQVFGLVLIKQKGMDILKSICKNWG